MKKKEPCILIADDHEMLLEGLYNFIVQNFPLSEVFMAKDKKGLFNNLNQHKVDVLILDLMLGTDDSRTFLPQITHANPEMKIVVVSSLEETAIVSTILKSGAHGFVGKSCSITYIIEAISEVLKGREYVDPELSERIENWKNQGTQGIVLTDREKEVLNETLRGNRIKDIAKKLDLSTKTVEYHRSNLFVKFQVRNVTGLVKKTMLLGYTIQS